MSTASPVKSLPLFVLAFGLLVFAWVVFAEGGKKAPTPPMFAEGLTFEQATERSREQGKPIFAVFSATWCAPCQSFKRGALVDPRAEKLVKENFIAAYVDIDEQRSAARMFNVSGVPAIAVIRGGKRLRGAIGALDADELVKFLEEAKKQAEAKN